MLAPPSPAPLRYVVGLGVLLLFLSGLLAYDIALCLTFPVSPLSATLSS